jgi:oryzin
MSISGPANSMYNAVINGLYDAGMTVVVAAGNAGLNACNYTPAQAKRAITVAATDVYDIRPNWSNWGGCVNLHAPGVSIYSTWNTCDTCYNTISGTSMGSAPLFITLAHYVILSVIYANLNLATPHVAGLAAYFIAKNGLTSPASVLQTITKLATSGTVTDPRGSPNLIAYNGNGR